MANKFYLNDKWSLIGYVEEPCRNCGRVRLEKFVNTDNNSVEICCEKCDFNHTLGKYEEDL